MTEASSDELAKQANFGAAVTEDLLIGARRLRQVFLLNPIHYADRGTLLAGRGGAEPQILLVRNGLAYRSCVLADGRRAILDILTPGDIIGLDHIVVAHPVDEFTAACRLGYSVLNASEVRQLMTDQRIALRVFALLAEARWRTNRLAVGLGRLDALSRICLFLLDIYDRLRRRGVLNRPSFNLPLTQEQIADHLGLTVVHVNRTLRRLREERLLMLDRQVVIILDLERLRQIARGLPPSADIAEPAELLDAYSLDG
jgi:CRP/FNR family transcriptional regulator